MQTSAEGEASLFRTAIGRGARGEVHRRKLPDERRSITHKFDIAGHEGYITAGMYEDGNPGEIFVSMSKQGSTISGLMDSFATGISYALQYGVPLQFLVDKFAHMRFEPSGFTKNPQIPYAKSIVDYLFRWLASKFLDEQARQEVGVIAPTQQAYLSPAAAGASGPSEQDNGASKLTMLAASALRSGEPALLQQDGTGLTLVRPVASIDLTNGHNAGTRQSFINQADAPPCPDCGCIMVRNGTCYKCLNCGATSGCS